MGRIDYYRPWERQVMYLYMFITPRRRKTYFGSFLGDEKGNLCPPVYLRTGFRPALCMYALFIRNVRWLLERMKFC